MYPYTFYPVYDDEYEQFARAQQARQRRQAYEQQQYLEYLRQQQYLEQQQQLRGRAYREYQLREQERLQRLAREREVKRQRQLQAQIEAEQQAEHRRRCQQAAHQRRLFAEQQALREQIVNRHDDGPITLSLFDLLDHIQRQQQQERNGAKQIDVQDDDDETGAGDDDAFSDTSIQDRLESLPESIDPPTVWHETNDPRVSEPPSPPVELVDEDLVRAMQAASLGNAATVTNKKPTKDKEAVREQQKKNHQANEANLGILRTIKPRLDLEIERFEGIVSKVVTDADSARLKLRSLKEAHMRVEAIYEQLDELRVSRKLRSQKHTLTSTAVQLADKVDDEIAEAQAQASKFPRTKPQNSGASHFGSDSNAVPGSPASTASSSAKHHVTLEEVDE